MSLERSDENHEGQGPPAQLSSDGESVKTGHLEVEQHDVGIQRHYLFHRLLAAPRLAHQFHVRAFFDQFAQHLPRHGLVIDDEYSHRARSSFCSTGPFSIGTLNDTQVCPWPEFTWIFVPSP